MGKTGLIQHLFHQPEVVDSYSPLFVDIYATRSLSELVYQLGRTILTALKPKKEVWRDKFFTLVKSLTTSLKIDPMTGTPSVELGLGDIRLPEVTLDELFAYLEASEKPCLVAIDEFQQIGDYPEKNTEALLRTKIQQCRNTQFIFSGSKRHMMTNMFHSASRPFYQSAVTMGLEALPEDVYIDFCQKLFAQYDKSVSAEVIHKVFEQLDGCTWYMQMLMNELFAITPVGGHCDGSLLPLAWDNVLLMQDDAYKGQLAQLPPRQKTLLQVIAREKMVRGITSTEFISSNKLSSASSVQSALKALLRDDIVTQEDDQYRIYDYFYAEWLRRNL